MKNDNLIKRVQNLSEKLKDPPKPGLLRIDYDSYSETEKLLFSKAAEVSEEYRRTGDVEVLFKNDDLTAKAIYVVYKRLNELYSHVIPEAISGYTLLDPEIVTYFFKLHFLNFKADLIQCINHLHTWTASDRQDFLDDLKMYGPRYHRIPRGFNEDDFKGFSCLIDPDDQDTSVKNDH